MSLRSIAKQIRRQLQRRAERPRALWLLAASVLAALLAALVAYLRDRHFFPAHEEKRDVFAPDEEPIPIPDRAKLGATPLQLTGDGTGPLFHRRYRADIRQPTQGIRSLMTLIQHDPNDFCPVEMARFEKTKGQPGQMQVGDEYLVHILGPWNGPVRVIDVQPTSFSLVTMEGHLEAGEIRFRLWEQPEPGIDLRFEITSWARSRDMLVDLAYDKMKVVKQGQTSIWSYFCEAVVDASGGELIGDIEILTEKSPFRGEVIPNA